MNVRAVYLTNEEMKELIELVRENWYLSGSSESSYTKLQYAPCCICLLSILWIQYLCLLRTFLWTMFSTRAHILQLIKSQSHTCWYVNALDIDPHLVNKENLRLPDVPNWPDQWKDSLTPHSSTKPTPILPPISFSAVYCIINHALWWGQALPQLGPWMWIEAAAEIMGAWLIAGFKIKRIPQHLAVTSECNWCHLCTNMVRWRGDKAREGPARARDKHFYQQKNKKPMGIDALLIWCSVIKGLVMYFGANRKHLS